MVRRGVPKLVAHAKAWSSTRIGRVPSILAVTTEPDPTSPGQPKELFKGQYESNPWDTSYDVTSTNDGPKFLMIKLPQIAHLNVILNWSEELKILISAD